MANNKKYYIYILQMNSSHLSTVLDNKNTPHSHIICQLFLVLEGISQKKKN